MKKAGEQTDPLGTVWNLIDQGQLWGAATVLAHSRSHVLLRDLMAVSDVVVLFASAMLASWLRFGTFIPTDHLLMPAFAAPLFYMAAMMVLRGYHTLDPQTLQMGLLRLCCAQAISFALLLGIAYFSKVSDDFSRLWTGYFALIGVASLVLLRLCAFGLIRALGKQKSFHPKIVLISSSPTPSILEMLEQRIGSQHQYRIIHRSIINGRKTGTAALQAELNKIRALAPDMIILAISQSDRARFADQLDDIDAISADILEVGDLSSHMSPCAPNRDLSLEPGHEWIVMAGLPFIRRAMRPFGQRGWWIKRAEDIILGLIAVIIAAPVMLVVAFAIKLTSAGPVLYVQKRHGFNGETIRVLKFRSMYVDQCATQREDTVPQATRNDPRITPVGKFIRKTSLDELPQLFNVLRGDMSLVGPRPHATQHNTAYRTRIDGYFARHRVKPGITGWAQVNGWRGETDTDEKMRQRVLHDMYYIANWSPWLDIRVVILTVLNGLTNPNAY